MTEIPSWHIVGDWFDNCSCAVALENKKPYGRRKIGVPTTIVVRDQSPQTSYRIKKFILVHCDPPCRFPEVN